MHTISTSLQLKIRQLQDPDLSTVDLQTLLNTFHTESKLNDADSLLLASILFNRTIPQTYVFLDTQTKNVIYELLASKVGMAQLLRTIMENVDPNKRPTSTATTPAVKVDDIFLLVDVLLNLIESKLDVLLENFATSSKLESDSLWKPLLTIKIMDCLGAILIWLFEHTSHHKSVDIDRNEVKLVSEHYVTHLIEKMVTTLAKNDTEKHLHVVRCIITYYLNKEPHLTFNVLKEHWQQCITIFSLSENSSPKQKFQLYEEQTKFIYGLYALIENDVKDIQSCHLYSQLVQFTLKKMNPVGMKDKMILKCSNASNLFAVWAWVKALGKVDLNYTIDTLRNFGNKEYITNTSMGLQRCYTSFIIVLLMSMDDDQLQNLSTEKAFLEATTNRLESKSTSVRELGMFVADYIYERINGKSMFNIPSYETKKEEFMTPLHKLNKCSQVKSDVNIENIFQEIRALDTNQKELIISQENSIVESQPVMIDINYDSDADDSDLDDPSVSRRANVAKPVFLKDLHHYFLSDPQKDRTAYDKRSIAFSIGIEMVRVKRETPELRYYSTKLIDATLDLDDVGFPLRQDGNFTNDQVKNAFNSWKVSFMVALCVSEPDIVVNYLMENFLKQDWSIPTRVQVLSCIGLSCRELCGKSDDFIWGKQSLDKAKPQQLPGPGHELFLSLNKENKELRKIVDVEEEERDIRLVEALEGCEISEGKTLRRSRKLSIDKCNAKLTASRTINTSFINKKLPKIFYSMTAIWQEVNVHTYGMGFQVGYMSEYLNSHYLEILAMIYACGIPLCMELVEMSTELVNILNGQLRAIQTSQLEEFPTLQLKSIIDSLRLLLTENDQTISILKTLIPLELTLLLEGYAQVLSDCPPLEEPTNTLSMLILQELQRCSSVYSS